MSQFSNAWLAGLNAGGEQASRAASIAELIQRMQLARADQDMQTERQGWQRDDRALAVEDRNRTLAARGGAQRYFANRAAMSGMFDTVDPMSGYAQSDVGMHDAFAQMDPSMQATQLWHEQESQRWQDQNDTRLAVAQVSAAAKRRNLTDRAAAIESQIRPKFGDEVADQALEELYNNGHISEHTLAMTRPDPMRDVLLQNDPYLRQAAGPGVFPGADGMGPTRPNPLGMVPSSELMRYSTDLRQVNKQQQGEMTPEEEGAAARDLMMLHPNTPFDTALAAVRTRNRKLPIGLGEANFTGEQRAQPLSSDREYKALSHDTEIAKMDLEDFERQHSIDIKIGLEGKLKQEHEVLRSAVRNSIKKEQEYLRGSGRQSGPASTRAGAAASPAKGNAIRRAWRELGEKADPAKVAERASEILSELSQPQSSGGMSDER